MDIFMFSIHLNSNINQPLCHFKKKLMAVQSLKNSDPLLKVTSFDCSPAEPVCPASVSPASVCQSADNSLALLGPFGCLRFGVGGHVHCRSLTAVCDFLLEIWWGDPLGVVVRSLLVEQWFALPASLLPFCQILSSVFYFVELLRPSVLPAFILASFP